MDTKGVVQCIDAGANFYVSLFGIAEHMEMVDNGFYTYLKPKEGQQGISFIFHVRLDHLPARVQKEKVEEMKALGMPIWASLLSSDELYFLIYGKEKVHGQKEFQENDEIYMALLPEEKPAYPVCDTVRMDRVKTAEDFALWAQTTNDLLSGGYPDIHPVYHYPLCQKGMMQCYLLYQNDAPAAVAAVLDNNGVASLEFVATIPQMRRRGLAQAVCQKAILDTFTNGASIITVRAINATAMKLYQALGFKIYNAAI